MLVSGYATKECLLETNNCKQYGEVDNTLKSMSPRGDISIVSSGKYDCVVIDKLLRMMEAERKVNVYWTFDEKKLKQSSYKHRLSQDFVKVLHQRLQSSIGIAVTGFTKAVISCAGVRTPFYAHPCFHGHKWYDRALAHFEEYSNQGDFIESHYPLQILGYISIDGKQEAAVQ